MAFLPYFIPSASLRLLRFNQDHPSKSQVFFWSNPYKINCVRTSLIEMLQSWNFYHMTTSIIEFESCDKILLVTSSKQIMTSLLFLKFLSYFQETWSSQFCWHQQKRNYVDESNRKEVNRSDKNYKMCFRMFYYYLLMYQIGDFWWKKITSA